MPDPNLAPALREAADLLAELDIEHQPYVTSSTTTGTVILQWFLHIDYDRADLAGQKAAAASLVRSIGGTWNKHEWSSTFSFTQTRGLLHLSVDVVREAVCERVVVGTEKVEVPAQEAQLAVEAHTVEREVVEWRCQPLLAEDRLLTAVQETSHDPQAAHTIRARYADEVTS